MNDKLKEIMSSKCKLINEIDKNGFDVLEKYKVYDCKLEDGLIKEICFELKNNQLNRDWDWNGCIILIFDYKDDKMKCQVQVEAVTNKIDYSNFYEYERYYDCDMDDIQKHMPNFKNEEEYLDYDYFCNFSTYYNIAYYKTINILKNVTEKIIKCDKNIEECINTQIEIDEFEQEYYKRVLEINFDKDFDEITEEELREYEWEQNGISTYNMMVREGWIDED